LADPKECVMAKYTVRIVEKRVYFDQVTANNYIEARAKASELVSAQWDIDSLTEDTVQIEYTVKEVTN
jgi:hypothetical protein